MKSDRSLVAAEEKKRTLPEIMAQATAITQALIEAGGELSPELEKRLELNKQELAQKVDAYIFIDDRFQAEAKFFAERAKAYQKIARSFERLSDVLRERVKQVMVETDTKEIRGDEYRFVLSPTQPRLVIEEGKLPREFLIQVTTVTPDKERIKTTLKDGFEIPGATLEGGFALRSYLNGKKEE